MKDIKVLIADDHYIVRLGLKVLINSFDGYHVTEEAQNGNEALDFIKNVDICFLDLEMPEKNGIEVLDIIKKKYPFKKVVLLTNTMDILTLIRARDYKPDGFIFKDGLHEEIKVCLDQISKGNYYMSDNCSVFFKRHANEVNEVKNIYSDLKCLTKRELLILSKISKNKSTSEIAEILCNSPKTIDNHRTNIAKKIDISEYNNLQAFAMQSERIVLSVIKDLGYDQ